MKFLKLFILLIIFVNIFSKVFSSSRRMTHKNKLKKVKVGSRVEMTELQIIGTYAYLCYMAYIPSLVEEKEQLKKRGWEFVGKASYEDFGAYAYVAYNLKHRLVVTVFRGSDRMQNWIINSRWQKAEKVSSYPKGVRIHEGFHIFYLSLVEQLDKLVYEAVTQLYEASKDHKNRKGIRFMVTGHSLGGAGATLYARHLQTLDSIHSVVDSYKELSVKHKQPKVVFHGHIKLYTFGVPRIGDKTFADTVNGALKKENIYNVIFKNDPVPHLNKYDPSSFVHAGTIYRCENTEACTKYLEDPQDSITLNNFMSAFWGRNDHSSENYFKIGKPTN